MSERTRHDVTQLLHALGQGDQRAAEELLPLVYEELRKLARARMAHEPADHTLQATALVHEAYLRLVNNAEDKKWDGRGHFFGAAAQAMRRILVDRARARNAAKRGGGRHRVDLDPDDLVATPRDDDSLEALDEALSRLAVDHPKLAQLVQLKHFGGLTLAECADVLDVSPRTADTWWSYARAWLAVALKTP